MDQGQAATAMAVLGQGFGGEGMAGEAPLRPVRGIHLPGAFLALAAPFRGCAFEFAVVGIQFKSPFRLACG